MEVQGALYLSARGRAAQLRRLPLDATVHLGRAMSWGLPRDAAWVPRELAALEPVPTGWRLHVGSAAVSLAGLGIRHAEFEPGATFVLEHGDWTLHWTLNHALDARIVVDRRLPPECRRAAVAPGGPLAWPSLGTDIAGRDSGLTATQQQRMAVLFRHLLEGHPPPANLCSAAAADLGMTEAYLRSYANRLRRRLNEQRDEDLPDLDALGDYLRSTGAIRPSDLRRR